MAIDFVPGSSQYIHAKNGGILVPAGDFSIALWATIDVVGQCMFYSEGNAANNTVALNMYTYDDGAGTNLYFYARNDAASELFVVSAGIVSTGAWHHFVVTRSGTAWVSYIDGASESTTATLPATYTVNTADAGAWRRLAPAGYHDGRMEDLRVYNRLLGGNEVLSLSGGYRGPLGGEALWYQMLEPEGALPATILDMSGGGNHGTPSGSPLGAASYAPRMNGWIP